MFRCPSAIDAFAFRVMSPLVYPAAVNRYSHGPMKASTVLLCMALAALFCLSAVQASGKSCLLSTGKIKSAPYIFWLLGSVYWKD